MHDNLRNLGLERLEVVNLRINIDMLGPAEGSIEAPLATLAELQHRGLVRHIGLSNVTAAQVAEARRICDIICVQNHYNLAHRADDHLIDDLSRTASRMFRFSPSAVSARCNPLPCPRSPRASAQPLCRWRLPGCSVARPTSF